MEGRKLMKRLIAALILETPGGVFNVMKLAIPLEVFHISHCYQTKVY